MNKKMTIYYQDGEIESFEVYFEAYDIEVLIAPMTDSLVFEQGEKQVCIMLDKVKKIEFEGINGVDDYD